MLSRTISVVVVVVVVVVVSWTAKLKLFPWPMKHHDCKIALQHDATCIKMCTVDICGQEAVLHCFGLGCPKNSGL